MKKHMMKKTLAVAAIAAMTMSAGAANAAMSNGASGDSSLILTLLDNTNNISATFDLGLNYSTLPTAASQVWNLAATGNYAAAWTSFLGTAALTGSKWAVYAADNVGSGAGGRGLITTYASGTTMAQNQLQTGMTNFDGYINANNPLGTHPAALNGASSAISGAAFAESAAYGTTSKINNQGSLIVMKGLDQSMDVVKLAFVGTNNGASASFTMLGNAYGNSTFNMTSNGVLSYTAPVPEADTWALLLAGIGMMGFMVRRRTAV
jgi:hypothetical protein